MHYSLFESGDREKVIERIQERAAHHEGAVREMLDFFLHAIAHGVPTDAGRTTVSINVSIGYEEPEPRGAREVGP
jgi:hypothetical protein